MTERLGASAVPSISHCSFWVITICLEGDTGRLFRTMGRWKTSSASLGCRGSDAALCQRHAFLGQSVQPVSSSSHSRNAELLNSELLQPPATIMNYNAVSLAPDFVCLERNICCCHLCHDACGVSVVMVAHINLVRYDTAVCAVV